VYIGLADEEHRGRAGIDALDAVTGEAKWHFATASSVRNTVAVASGLVYGVTVEGEVVAVDAGSGSLKWKYDIGEPVQRSLCMSPVVRLGQLPGLARRGRRHDLYRFHLEQGPLRAGRRDRRAALAQRRLLGQ
jgi:outer membrane protein assembly factor BamB